jgi:hypothetical protein
VNVDRHDPAARKKVADSEQLSTRERRIIGQTLESEFFGPTRDPLPNHDPIDERHLAELAAVRVRDSSFERTGFERMTFSL